MKLEAGKEMDRQCVVNWLNEVYVTPSRAFSEYTDDELKMFAHDALVLLKEQEAVKPIPPEDEFGLYRCGKCYHQLFRCVDKYCSRCGQAVEWNG